MTSIRVILNFIRLRAFPNPENASQILIQARDLCIEAKIGNSHNRELVLQFRCLGDFLGRKTRIQAIWAAYFYFLVAAQRHSVYNKYET